MKFILRLVLIFFLLCVGMVACGPLILSTRWGKDLLIFTVNHTTKMHLSLDVLRLSWSQDQQIAGLKLVDKQGNLLLSCDELTTDASLWQIFAKEHLGHLKATAPKATIQPRGILLSPALKAAGFVPSISAEMATTPLLTFSYTGEISVERGELDFINPGLDPIHVENIQLQADLLSPERIQVQAEGQTIQNQLLGSFELKGSLSEAEAHFVNFPTRCADQVAALFDPRFVGVFVEGIGEALNVDLHMRHSPHALELILSAEAANLTAHFETQMHGDVVTLKSPASLSLKINPPFAAKFAGLQLKEPASLKVEVSEFQLPLDNQEAYSFKASGELSQISLPDATISPAKFSIQGKQNTFTATFDSPQLQVPEMQLRYSAETLTLLQPVHFTGVAQGTLSQFILPETWENLKLEGELEWRGKATINVNSLADARVEYVFHDLVPLQSAPATMYIHLEPPKSLYELKGIASVETLALHQIQVNHLEIPFQYDRKKKSLSANATASVHDGELEAKLHLQDTLFNMQGTLQKIPTSLLEFYLENTQALGEEISLQFQLSSSPETQIFSLIAQSDLLDLHADFEHKDAYLSLKNPATLNYTLNPKEFVALNPSNPFILKEPATLHLTLDRLDFPTTSQASFVPSVNFDMHQTCIQGGLSISHLLFSEKGSYQSTSLENFQFQLSQAKPGTPLSYTLFANVMPQGKISVQGSFDPMTESFTSDASIQQLPTSLFDLVAHLFGSSSFSYASLLGEHLNLSAHAQVSHWNGPIKGTLNTPSVQASFDGSLKDGVFALNEPIYAQLQLTSEISQTVLKEVNPLSVSGIRSQSPLTLNISEAGFSFPVKNFDLKAVSIPQARIELGQIYCQNEGNLNIVLGLLKLSQFSRGKEMELWFAPLDLHLKEGILSCDRTEILVARAYDICTWGTVNLNTDMMDMVLGLTQGCLKKAFGIKKLPSDYVFQIPLKGPTSNVQIDGTTATAKLATLMLWQQKAVAGAALGGPAGAVLGELLDKVTAPPGMDVKTPPAKRPFPWEIQGGAEEDSEEDAPKKKKKHISLNDKPLKQLFKLLK